jgi:hypothetical protein
MGQAKRRGTFEQRAAAAKVVAEAERAAQTAEREERRRLDAEFEASLPEAMRSERRLRRLRVRQLMAIAVGLSVRP